MVERKQLLVGHEKVTCEVCERTLLTGERATFLAEPGHSFRLVCELCAVRARRDRWAPSEVHWARSGRVSVKDAIGRVAHAGR